ncbi:unnamed protein product, partial [Nesidiocoris tenuis]
MDFCPLCFKVSVSLVQDILAPVFQDRIRLSMDKTMDTSILVLFMKRGAAIMLKSHDSCPSTSQQRQRD